MFPPMKPPVRCLSFVALLGINFLDAVQIAPFALRLADNMTQARSHNEGATHVHGTCLPPGQLKYAHVMKSGGLSVDAYLGCRCEREGCSISHHEGGDALRGDLTCEEPTICTSHKAPFQMWEECTVGNFSQARIFTVLREPVARVVSFYNYMRDPRPADKWPGYKPYRKNSLMYVLQAWGKKDLNADQSKVLEEGGCVMCAAQLANAMVLRHFATKASIEEQASWNISGGVRFPPTRLSMVFALEEAKKALTKMVAVFLDIGTFKEAFERDDLLRPDLQSVSSECDVPLVNPTSKKKEPTEEEIELIKELNWADIELYNFAMTLPQARK